jgi:transposase
MRDLSSFPRILVYRGPVDFRKRRRSLAAVVQDQIKEDPFSATLFIFLNKRRDCLRALYWDKTGFAMWEKELEKDRFPWPRQMPREGSVVLQNQQVQWLLEGVDFWKLKPHTELEYSRVF